MEKASRYDYTQLGKILDVMAWSPQDVVEKLKSFGMEVSAQTITNWCNGLSAPDADRLDVLAMALGVDLLRFYPSEK